MKLNKAVVIFLILFVFGISLRLIQFPKVPFSLFSDEVDIGYQVMSFRETGKDYFGNFLPLQFHSFSDFRTSLPIYATVLVSYLPGVSIELAIRLAPLLFSFASLFLIYFFVNELAARFEIIKSTKTPGLPAKTAQLSAGHFAVLLMSLTPWQFTYSRTGFELSMLLFFNLLGFWLFLKFIRLQKLKFLIGSLIALGLTPMIYSTAKLAVIGYPLILWLLTDTRSQKTLLKKWYLGVIIFIPLLLVMINGGAGQRFSEIALYTDPTLATETNYVRQLDLGPQLIVGSSPSLITKIVHNKLTLIGGRFINNLITPISATYLFLKGDPNPRHAVPGWGMLLKTFLLPLIAGLYFLIQKKQNRLLLIGIIFATLAIIPSALTRDGADHSSRLYLLIIPLTLIGAFGLASLTRFRAVILALICLILIDSFFYFHYYFVHYPYEAAKDFHYGLKEVVIAAAHENKVTVISPNYEPPLIFYLFYNHFPPAKFQTLMKDKKLYHQIGNDLNLEGFQLGDEPIYLAGIRNVNAAPLYPVKGIYYMTRLEAAAIFGSQLEKIKPFITTPDGLQPLFYRIEVSLDNNPKTSPLPGRP